MINDRGGPRILLGGSTFIGLKVTPSQNKKLTDFVYYF